MTDPYIIIYTYIASYHKINFLYDSNLFILIAFIYTQMYIYNS